MNAVGPGPLPEMVLNEARYAAPSAFLDTNQDGSLTPLDALVVINRLNAQPPGGEGESFGWTSFVGVLNDDVDGSEDRDVDWVGPLAATESSDAAIGHEPLLVYAPPAASGHATIDVELCESDSDGDSQWADTPSAGDLPVGNSQVVAPVCDIATMAELDDLLGTLADDVDSCNEDDPLDAIFRDW